MAPQDTRAKIYQGRLARPPTGEELIRAFELDPNDLHCELFVELFAHFEIAADDPHRWEYLARALARQHVPAFRPKKRRGPRLKVLAITRFVPKKEPGRKPKWDDIALFRLLLDLRRGRAVLGREPRTVGMQPHERITNERALTAAYIVEYQAQGITDTTFRRKAKARARTDAKRVSRALRKFPDFKAHLRR